MTTSKSRGAYYLQRSLEYWKNLGWRVQKLEFANPFPIRGKIVWGKKRDVFGADLAIWNDKEIKLVQVKSVTQDDRVKGKWQGRDQARRAFAEWGVPLPKLLMIWEPRKMPSIEIVE